MRARPPAAPAQTLLWCAPLCAAGGAQGWQAAPQTRQRLASPVTADAELALQKVVYFVTVAHLGTGAAAGVLASRKGKSPLLPALKVRPRGRRARVAPDGAAAGVHGGH